MACTRPLEAYRWSDGAITLCVKPRSDACVVYELNLPCGRCPSCLFSRSREWALRICHEASLYPDNSFITLTYNDDNLPVNNSLVYRDFQLFLKRLRKNFDFPIRFYMTGEYGETFGRPHYHAILFGLKFPDTKLWKRTPAGSFIYRSNILERLWPFGYSSIGEVTFESAAYVARYVIKKRFGDDSQSHYELVNTDTGEVVDRTPEFNRMSLKPGIGFNWFDKFSSDVYPGDYVIFDNKKLRPPRYYDKILEREDPELFLQLKQKRLDKMLESDNIDLEAEGEIVNSKLEVLKRTLL